MFQETRKEKIIDLLKSEKQYRVSDLQKYFKVSLATIHRDLNDLEREGRVRKVHGGVILNVAEDIETKNTIRLKTNIELKKKVALKALEYIKNGDCLFLDNSTTCYYLGKELAASGFKELIVITNSYPLPGLFVNNSNIRVILTGGIFLNDLNCFIGPSAVRTINEFNADKFFFSTAAISIESNLSDIYRPDSDEIKKQMFKRSRERICIVDSTKFNKSGQSVIFHISDVDKIITDSNCSKETIENFLRKGNELIIT